MSLDRERWSMGRREPAARALQLTWLARFMQYVDMRWPHPQHAAYNQGRGGAGPWTPLGCPADFILPGADLVILEFAINGGGRNILESVGSPPPPPSYP